MGYSKEIYELAEQVLEKRRLYSEQELQKRRANLYRIEPRAEKIEKEMSQTGVSAGKAVLAGKDVRLELIHLREKNQSLQKELREILQRRNYPQNYLQQWYHCNLCKDTGYVGGKRCECMTNLLKQKAYENLNQISALSLSDFQTFSLKYYSKEERTIKGITIYEHMQKNYNYCRRYAANFHENSNSLLFQGPPGLGKTHLSLAIAKVVIDKGYGVIYVSAPEILTKLENEYFNGDKSSKGQSRSLLIDCDLLILDDLGTEFPNKFYIAALYDILNTRMIYSKPTIISTNLITQDLQDHYSARLVSRIIGAMPKVTFFGTDIRQMKKRESK